MEQVKVAAFKPKSDVKIATTDAEAKQMAEAHADDYDVQVLTISTLLERHSTCSLRSCLPCVSCIAQLKQLGDSLPSAKGFGKFRLQPAEFEKVIIHFAC